MSYLIKQDENQQENSDLIRKIQPQIRYFMQRELSATRAVYGSNDQVFAFVNTVKGKIFNDIQIYWLVTFQKLGVKLKGIPSSLKSLGVDLIVDSQRLYIDLSKFLSQQNKKLKNRYTILINQAGHICVQAYIGFAQAQNPRTLGYILKLITLEMKNILEDKIKFIQPYMSMFNHIQQQKIDKQNSTQQKICNFIILNQIYRQHRQQAYQQNNLPDSTVLNKMNTFSKDDLKYLQYLQKNNLFQREKIRQYLGVIFPQRTQKQNDLTKKFNKIKNAQIDFCRQKQKKSLMHRTFRNVYGVRDIQQISNQNQLQSNGSHSSLSIASYHFKILNTIHSHHREPSPKKKLKQQPKRNQGINLLQKQTYLIKKTCKDKEQIVSFNSFKNQIQFICYIRDRFCKHISTYYWDTTKQKNNTQEIYMDYYPQNIYQFFMKTHEDRQILSLQHKIDLLQQILVCLNFLTQNFVCHRDVKLQNIMISVSRQIKMIDFGSSAPIFGRKQFNVPQKRLLGTESYHYPYSQCPQSVKKQYKASQYEQHMLFDAYSFGTIIQKLMGKEDFTKQNNPIVRVQVLLYYIKQKCHQIDPVDRLTYAQMLYLFKLIKEVIKCQSQDSLQQDD